MAASPRPELAASSVQAPVNPSTPARAAQNEDPLEDLAAAVAALDEEEEEEPEDKKKALRRSRAMVMWGRDVG